MTDSGQLQETRIWIVEENKHQIQASHAFIAKNQCSRDCIRAIETQKTEYSLSNKKEGECQFAR